MKFQATASFKHIIKERKIVISNLLLPLPL